MGTLDLPDGAWPRDRSRRLHVVTAHPLGSRPRTRVAVVGLGGRGHMGVKIASALAVEVSILGRADDKRDDGRTVGATAFHATSDPARMHQLRTSFDLIINTVSVDPPIASYLRLLRAFGVLVNVGLPTAAYEIPPSLIVGTIEKISADEVGAASTPRRCRGPAVASQAPVCR